MPEQVLSGHVQKARNSPAHLFKSIRKGDPPYICDLHGYTCAAAKQLMVDAFTNKLAQHVVYTFILGRGRHSTEKYRVELRKACREGLTAAGLQEDQHADRNAQGVFKSIDDHDHGNHMVRVFPRVRPAEIGTNTEAMLDVLTEEDLAAKVAVDIFLESCYDDGLENLSVLGLAERLTEVLPLLEEGTDGKRLLSDGKTPLPLQLRAYEELGNLQQIWKSALHLLRQSLAPPADITEDERKACCALFNRMQQSRLSQSSPKSHADLDSLKASVEACGHRATVQGHFKTKTRLRTCEKELAEVTSVLERWKQSRHMFKNNNELKEMQERDLTLRRMISECYEVLNVAARLRSHHQIVRETPGRETVAQSSKVLVKKDQEIPQSSDNRCNHCSYSSLLVCNEACNVQTENGCKKAIIVDQVHNKGSLCKNDVTIGHVREKGSIVQQSDRKSMATEHDDFDKELCQALAQIRATEAETELRCKAKAERKLRDDERRKQEAELWRMQEANEKRIAEEKEQQRRQHEEQAKLQRELDMERSKEAKLLKTQKKEAKKQRQAEAKRQLKEAALEGKRKAEADRQRNMQHAHVEVRKGPKKEQKERRMGEESSESKQVDKEIHENILPGDGSTCRHMDDTQPSERKESTAIAEVKTISHDMPQADALHHITTRREEVGRSDALRSGHHCEHSHLTSAPQLDHLKATSAVATQNLEPLRVRPARAEYVSRSPLELRNCTQSTSTPEEPCTPAVQWLEHSVKQPYICEAGGYMSIFPGDVLRVVMLEPEPGDPGCCYSKYVFGKREPDGAAGWVPEAVLWRRYLDENCRPWLYHSSTGHWRWEDDASEVAVG